ncbi:NADH:flavin oxidoreductase/NADH oxidase [Motilibacter aurantiacus]|uniref:NADH:flavin oxidoreductase/NADH oxidase n=1 Tax=Motilibacter aurantiacus TaxID=2714955 RepID=UPI001407822A|nr:NADH:flavin oxidoreductase/NADH oxidase [Motilibacter aurantiacus]NHC47289.1 NADH:flavin oxidoreductase/NADH oxidase [Motilibacter aurantiacus]
MSLLLSPLTLRGTTLRNRAWVAPMCQYSAVEGMPNDWHLVHLGGLARGGAGLVISEATAVTPEGRISPADTGIWADEQATAWRRITDFVRSQGAVPGIQLGHAGRKASTQRPWAGRAYVDPADGGWPTVGPSAVAYADWPVPRELTRAQVAEVVQAFADAARRADEAGFEVVELHAAHGYLLHQFLSPLSNHRTDEYGGSFENRSRVVVEAVDAVRSVWPESRPLLVRLSATDWAPGGWTVEETVRLSKELAGHGVDLVDVSSGGLAPEQRVEVGPGYQVPFARAVREGSGLPTAAVGLITEPAQAEAVLAEGSADAVLLARAVLRDPHWPLRAAAELGDDVAWPVQYERAKLA